MKKYTSTHVKNTSEVINKIGLDKKMISIFFRQLKLNVFLVPIDFRFNVDETAIIYYR